LIRWLIVAVVALILLPYLIAPLYRVVDPVSTLMLGRWILGKRVERTVVPLNQVAPVLPRTVIASEDARFCTHAGFDWIELRRAYQEWRSGDGSRGASTITNQVAKNLFLWQGRSVIRKGLEAGFSVLIEALWSKDRILEVYLNIIEMGDGVYGAEAAARLHFKRRAAELSPLQGALIAGVLPSPRIRADALSAPYMRARAALIQQRMAQTPLGERRVCP